MTENVLTDEEVGALLDGVESGEIEVQSGAGRRYASIDPFVISPRAHIVSNSFPELEAMNERLAMLLGKRTEKLLQRNVDIRFAATATRPYGDIRAQTGDAAIATTFSMAPLNGNAAIVFSRALVHQLVEVFFGGVGTDSDIRETGIFTYGEKRVLEVYADLALKAIEEIWEPTLAVTARRERLYPGTAAIGISEDADAIIESVFDVGFGACECSFSILLPEAILSNLLPVFKGSARREDPAQDAQWAETIRDGLTDTRVGISATVGHAEVTLGELVCLEPGDVIDIVDPTQATLYAGNVALLAGRYGVHDGTNAVEAAKWLNTTIKNLIRN